MWRRMTQSCLEIYYRYDCPRELGCPEPVCPRQAAPIDVAPITRRCGPDISMVYIYEIWDILKEVDRRRLSGGNPLDPIWDAVNNGGSLDYKNGVFPRGLPSDRRRDCPTACPHTVTLCDMCMREDTPGNFAFGLLMEAYGPGFLANLGSHAFAAWDLKWDDDQDAVNAGRDAARGLVRGLMHKDWRLQDKPLASPVNWTRLHGRICGALRRLSLDHPEFFSSCEPCA